MVNNERWQARIWVHASAVAILSIGLCSVLHAATPRDGLDEAKLAAGAATGRLAQDALSVSEWWQEHHQEWELKLAVGGIALGLVSVFYGLRLFKIILALVGLLAGGAVTWRAVDTVAHGTPWLPIASGVAGAILVCVLCIVAYYAMIFVVGAGAAVALTGLAQVPVNQAINRWAYLIPAAIGGVLALLLKKLVIVFCTAAGGAVGVVIGVYSLLGKATQLTDPDLLRRIIPDPNELPTLAKGHTIILPFWAALTILGILVQFRYMGAHKTHTPAPAQPA
jgi:hypothetical protein